MKPRQLWDELQRYGYIFSWKKSIGMYMLAVGMALLLSRFFQLQGACQMVLCGWVVFLLPFFLRNIYKNRYGQRQFLEANTYVEQFLYSFQKSGKILTTLEDVQKLFAQGEMKDAISDAIEYIRHTYNEDDVMERGLQIIYDLYPVAQIQTLHRFALQVEKNGGEYSGSILLMLDSRRLWADRIYGLLKEKVRRKVQIFVSICVSLLLCILLAIVARNMQIELMQYKIAQVSTLGVLMLNFFIFYRGDAKLAAGYMEEDIDESVYVQAYERLQKTKSQHKWSLGMRSTQRRVTRGIQMVFPRWLMDVSLLLQSENVQVAIMKSYPDAPALLKPELEKLIAELRLHPTDIEPYLSFLQDYPLPEVQSAMKMLYSISEGTGGNQASQIRDIIRRNQILLDKADHMRDEDALAGMYALFLAPQLTGAVKLLTDMLVIFYGLAQAGVL